MQEARDARARPHFYSPAAAQPEAARDVPGNYPSGDDDTGAVDYYSDLESADVISHPLLAVSADKCEGHYLMPLPIKGNRRKEEYAFVGFKFLTFSDGKERLVSFCSNPCGLLHQNLYACIPLYSW